MRRAASLLILSLPAAWSAPPGPVRPAAGSENGAVVAPAAIGGIAGGYVIDLSAPRTLLHLDVAWGAGLVEPGQTLPVRLAGQTVEAAPITVQSLDYRAVGFSTPIVRGDRRRHPGPLRPDPGLLALPTATGAPRASRAGRRAACRSPWSAACPRSWRRPRWS